MGAKGLTLKQHIEHTLGTGAVEDAVRLPPGEDLNEWLAVNTGGFWGPVLGENHGLVRSHRKEDAEVMAHVQDPHLKHGSTVPLARPVLTSPLLAASCLRACAVVFYNAINVLYQVLDETLCTSQVCSSPLHPATLVTRYASWLRHALSARHGKTARHWDACHPTCASASDTPDPFLPAGPPAHLQRCPVMSAGPQYEYLWADGIKVKTPLKLSAPDYINCLFDWVEDQVGRSAFTFCSPVAWEAGWSCWCCS